LDSYKATHIRQNVDEDANGAFSGEARRAYQTEVNQLEDDDVIIQEELADLTAIRNAEKEGCSWEEEVQSDSSSEEDQSWNPYPAVQKAKDYHSDDSSDSSDYEDDKSFATVSDRSRKSDKSSRSSRSLSSRSSKSMSSRASSRSQTSHRSSHSKYGKSKSAGGALGSIPESPRSTSASITQHSDQQDREYEKKLRDLQFRQRSSQLKKMDAQKMEDHRFHQGLRRRQHHDQNEDGFEKYYMIEANDSEVMRRGDLGTKLVDDYSVWAKRDDADESEILEEEDELSSFFDAPSEKSASSAKKGKKKIGAGPSNPKDWYPQTKRLQTKMET